MDGIGTWLEALISRWINVTVHRPRLVVAAASLLTALSLWYAVDQLGMNTDTNAMVPDDAPFRVAEDRYSALFPQRDDALIVVVQDAAAPAADRAVKAILAQLQQETGLYADIYAAAIDPFFERHGLLYQDLDELDQTIAELAEAQAALGTLARDPSLRGLLAALETAIEAAREGEPMPPGFTDLMHRLAAASRDAAAGRTPGGILPDIVGDEDGLNTRVLQTRLLLDYTDPIPSADGIERLREITEELRAAGKIAEATRVRLTGRVVLSYEELGSVAEGIAIAGVVSLTLLVIILGWGLRSARMIGATYIALFFGLAWTGAFAALTVGELNLLSASVAVLFIGLGLDHAIHFCLRYVENLGRGAGKSQALVDAGSRIGPALALCALTSSIGFLAFIPTDYRGFADLGVIAAGGMLMAFLSAIGVLPALLALFGTPERAGRAMPQAAIQPVLRGRLALVMGVLSLAAIPVALNAQFDFSTLALKDPDSESVQTLEDLTEEEGNASYSADVITSDRASAQALAARLKALPEVEDVITPDDFVPADQDEKLALIDEAAMFLWPVFNPEPLAPSENATSALQAAQRFTDEVRDVTGLDPETAGALDVFQKALDDLLVAPAAQSGVRALDEAIAAESKTQIGRLSTALEAGPFGFDDLPARIVDRSIASSGEVSLIVLPTGDMSDHDQVAAFADAVSGTAPDASGRPISEVATGRIVVGAFTLASGIAITLIALLLFLILRRGVDVGIVLLPLGAAFVLTTAVTVLTGMTFNFANVIVLPLLLGLGVDSGIHMILRRREQQDVSAVMDSSTPRAVVLSALTTIASFASLSLSPHWGMASLGLLLTIAMVFIILATIIMLPAMMARWGASRQI